MAATIKDIKEKTGLSLATISKFLNGGNVLPENREKIAAAIESLHYEVNEIARVLVTNRTKTVGVAVFSIESLFNGILLRHMGETLRRAGYAAIICDSNNDPDREAENIRFLLGKKVDGIIAIPAGRSGAFLRPAQEAGVPAVLLDRDLEDGGFDCVRIDNRLAARRAVEVLLAKGHRKIACISSAAEYTGLERRLGWLDAMERAGLEPPEAYQRLGFHSFEFGHQSMQELLRLPDRPTAVFMSNYEITLGGLMAVNESRFRCPADVSLLGFDNLLLSEIVEPRLYRVVQPMGEMAERAAGLLLQRMACGAPYTPETVILETRLETGNSILEISPENPLA